MEKSILVILTYFVFTFGSMAQNWGLKTNFLHWGAAISPNIGFEFALNDKYTVDISTAYNALTFNDNKKIKHWIVNPELRYWLDEAYDAHFVGIHGVASEFNIGGFNLPIGGLKNLKDFRYAGHAFGAGMSYGYLFPISYSMNFEFVLGMGYLRLQYDKYDCVRCGKKLETDVGKNYFGVTKAAMSLIFMF